MLALDVGSSSVRAQRFGEDGEPLDELRQERYDGHDPDEIVELVRTVVAGRDEDADAVGTSCFAHSLVGLDEAGRPPTPVLGWRDTRAAEAAEWLRAPGVRRGRRPRPDGRSDSPVLLAGEARLARRGAAGGLPRLARFVSFSDYLYAELLGVEPVTSLSIASGTGLLDLRDGHLGPGAARDPRPRRGAAARRSPTSRRTAGTRRSSTPRARISAPAAPAGIAPR